MKVLATKKPPLGHLATSDFESTFTDLFYSSNAVTTVTGYVSESSIADLNYMLQRHRGLKEFHLVIGMARFDGLTSGQRGALLETQRILSRLRLGFVSIPTAMPVHAKFTAFKSSTGESAIVGSSNLGALSKGFRQFNVDLVITDPIHLKKIRQIAEGVSGISRPLEEVIGEIPSVDNSERLLEGFREAKRELLPRARNIGPSFEIQLKTEAKSNLNVYFGRGRSGGRLPRPWYEVELIVSVDVTRQPGYPQSKTPQAEFQVVTDDGWSFYCLVSGQNSKNLRSSGDLEVLGRWIKGRLEQAGCLAPGNPVTDETLLQYGRGFILMYFDLDENIWRLDFSRPQPKT
jgi:hypothetical protein